jgi:hypothetical protein
VRILAEIGSNPSTTLQYSLVQLDEYYPKLSKLYFHDIDMLDRYESRVKGRCNTIIEMRLSTGCRLSIDVRNMLGKTVTVFYGHELVRWDLDDPQVYCGAELEQ